MATGRETAGSGLNSVMVPCTRNLMVADVPGGPALVASSADRSVPGPELARLDTTVARVIAAVTPGVRCPRAGALPPGGKAATAAQMATQAAPPTIRSGIFDRAWPSADGAPSGYLRRAINGII